MTQEDLSLKSGGGGFRFVRDLEQDKATLRLDKVPTCSKSNPTLYNFDQLGNN